MQELELIPHVIPLRPLKGRGSVILVRGGRVKVRTSSMQELFSNVWCHILDPKP